VTKGILTIPGSVLTRHIPKLAELTARRFPVPGLLAVTITPERITLILETH
jgi:hypothetical protein